MRQRPLFALLPAGVFVVLAWACASKNNPDLTVPDQDSGGALDGGDDGDGDDVNTQGPDSNAGACSFSVQGQTGETLDPVALCTQQQVLVLSEIQYAYTKGQGVAPGWASTGNNAPLTGHSWQDDLGLAGAIGGFYCSAEVYGNTSSDAVLSNTLADLGNVLSAELQQTPSPYAGVYDGELYFRLRWAQAAFNYANSVAATSMQTLANAYGLTLASQAFAVPAVDGGPAGGMVIGTKNADGSVTYSPAQAVMAAAALLDMATLQQGNVEAGAEVATWITTAQQVIAYVLARGKDPVTGLFYQTLVTSDAPGSDTVGPGSPTNDSMLTESQAWVMLGLARAQDLLDVLAPPSADGGLGDSGIPTQPIYWEAGNTLATALASAGLFDGTTTPPSPPPPGALMEGLVLSSKQLLTDKTTIGNAIMLGGFHRVTTGLAGPQTFELGELRSALTQLVPVNSSFLSVVTNASGDLIQQSYLRATSKDYGYAQAYSIGEAAGQGQEPGATNYRSDAVHAMIEGITQLWHGSTHDASCAP